LLRIRKADGIRTFNNTFILSIKIRVQIILILVEEDMEFLSLLPTEAIITAREGDTTRRAGVEDRATTRIQERRTILALHTSTTKCPIRFRRSS
jgi:hypothetical protein